MLSVKLREQSLWLAFGGKNHKSLPLAHTQLGIADVPKDSIEVEELAASTSELSIAEYRFDHCTPDMNIEQSGTLLTASCESCLLAPTLQSGSVYYLRFELLCYHHPKDEELFFGVTSNTDPAGLWLNTDAGWFLKDRRARNCRLTNMDHLYDAAWSGWQQGDQPVFKVDLITNMLHVRCARLHQDYTAKIAHRFEGAMFFCVTMDSPFDDNTVVKALPVLAVHKF